MSKTSRSGPATSTLRWTWWWCVGAVRVHKLLRPVPSTRLEFDPYLNDSTRSATSLRNHAEIMLPCLDAVGARTVVEVGAFAGDLTRLCVDWAAGSGAHIAAIDPSPPPGLEQLDREAEGLELIRETSLEALPAFRCPTW